MNLQSIVSSASDEGGLDDSLGRLAQASIQLKSLSDNVRVIHGKLGAAPALSFYNSLINSRMPVQLCAELAAYTAQVIRMPAVPPKEIEKLPSTIKDLIEDGKPTRDTLGQRYDPNIVTLFFQYIQKDPKYASVQNHYELVEYINRFNSMLGRLKAFFDRTQGNPDEVKITKRTYEELVATRDIRYEKRWTKMIDDLQTRYDSEMETPEDQRNKTKVGELHLALVQCEMIERFETQEKVNLQYLTKLPLTEKALNL